MQPQWTAGRFARKLMLAISTSAIII